MEGPLRGDLARSRVDGAPQPAFPRRFCSPVNTSSYAQHILMPSIMYTELSPCDIDTYDFPILIRYSSNCPLKHAPIHILLRLKSGPRRQCQDVGFGAQTARTPRVFGKHTRPWKSICGQIVDKYNQESETLLFFPHAEAQSAAGVAEE